MQKRMSRSFIQGAALSLGLGLAAGIAGALAPAWAQTGATAGVLWELRPLQGLAAQLDDIAIATGRPEVIATTPGAILAIGGPGEVRPLLRLQVGQSTGESAMLSRDASRAGILVHDHHVVSGFRLVDLQGQTLATIDAPLNFHYRLAPDGATFVGIDAGGRHVQATAERFVYHFYNDAGATLAEVESHRPQSMDSAYTSDGGAFVVNNGGGLSAFRVANGERLWQVAAPAHLFAAGPADGGFVVASADERRTAVDAYSGGSPLWRFTLAENVRQLAVSPDGRFILAADRGSAHLLSPQSGTPIWSFAMPDAEFTINSAAVNDRGVVALGAQHSSLTRGLALILDSDRSVLFERELSYGRSNAWIPGVQFDTAGGSLLVRTLEELILVATP